MADSVQIKHWMIPFLVSGFCGALTFGGTYSITKDRLARAEEQNKDDAAVAKIVYQQQAVIPLIQQDVQGIKTDIRDQGKKIDQILILVKQGDVR